MGRGRHKVQATDSEIFLGVYLTKTNKTVNMKPWPRPTGSEVIGLEVELLTNKRI